VYNVDNAFRKLKQKQLVNDRQCVIAPKITADNVDNACGKSAMKTDAWEIAVVIAAPLSGKNRQISSRRMQTAGENGPNVAPIRPPEALLAASHPVSAWRRTAPCSAPCRQNETAAMPKECNDSCIG
jgi:hypothetical protein